jgi:AraC-like DNA-binding protein
MPYREIPQHDPHIACLWTRDPEPQPQRNRILPDACVDIVWAGSRLVVAGPATGPVFTSIPANTAAFGVRFRVGAAGAALGLPAAEVLDANVPLEDVWPDGRELTERVGDRPSPEALAQFVRARIGAAPDALVRAAATGADPNLGARQLRRRFADAVGYGPKTLQRILRFQRFLALAQTQADLARLALEAGYADQAHLTRECSRLAGLPPAALLASGAGPAGDRSASFKTAGAVAATLAA